MEIVNRVEPGVEQKLAQPQVWGTLRCGVRVQELLPDLYDDVGDLIKTQLVPRETMSRALSMAESDPVSVATFVQQALCYMRDGTSIVGVAEDGTTDDDGNSVTKERVVAAMIGQVVQQRDHMDIASRVKMHRGEAYSKYAKLNCHMIRLGHLFSSFAISSYYRIHHIVVDENFENRGIALFLGKLATLRLTALFKQTICAKVCPDRPTQQLMRRLGFVDHLTLGYEQWIQNGQQVFFHTGVGNYSIALMTYKAGELGDVNQGLEEMEEEPEPEPEPRPPTVFPVFPGRPKTVLPSWPPPSAANRAYLAKQISPPESGRFADYLFLFHKSFQSNLRKENDRRAEKKREKEIGKQPDKFTFPL